MKLTSDQLRLPSLIVVPLLCQVKAAVLLALGGEDRRVPNSQGIKYYRTLKAAGRDIRCVTDRSCVCNLLLAFQQEYVPEIVHSHGNGSWVECTLLVVTFCDILSMYAWFIPSFGWADLED